MKTVRINRKGADRLAAGHPWIFSSDLLDRGGAEGGEAVLVAGPKDRLLGVAHYSAASQISLRLLSRQPEAIGPDFFLRRIRAAEQFRRRVAAGAEAYRVVHAEGDLLPALIVDRYGDYLVVQTLDQGMDRAKAEIVAALEELFAPRGIVERNDSAVRRHEDLPLVTGLLAGEAPPPLVQVRMNGLLFHADLVHGQKTGVFLDQRENYPAAARHAHGRALDCFTSTGGFALHMASHAESVTAIDSSAAVLEVARRNAAANGIRNVEFREANVFDLLAAERGSRRRYGTIVLDPPAFSKSRQTVDSAARGYKEINLRALELLEPGGVLVTCSCSHHVAESLLLEIVASASLDAARTLRVLDRRTQAQDHPILLTVPETHYLKCLILEVL